MLLSGVKAPELVMKHFHYPAAVGLLLILSTWVNAQEVADTLWLDEVRVRASRIDIQDTYQSVSSFRVDSTQLTTLESTSISDVLQFYTPLFIRNNGPGGLSTVNSRGFSSSQTQIIWNGFPLNHSMLGVIDLSIIPISTISELVTSSGTGNTSYGDRGGGTVAIQTKDLKNKLGVFYQIGSFGEQKYSVEAGARLSTISLGILMGFQSADNDFEYSRREFSNEAGGFVDVRKRRLFNENESATVLLSASTEIKQHEIESKLWILDSENQIPGGISSINDAAIQNDGFIRWISTWNNISGKNSFNGSIYVASQELDYIDESASINSLSDINTYAIDFSLKRSMQTKLQLITAIRAIRNSVETSEYPTDVSRDDISLTTNLVWSPTDFLFVYPSVSGNYNSDYGFNYTSELGLNAEILDERVYLKVHGGRNFVSPTFNDLYWPGLGDPNLETEEVLKIETSVLHQIRNSNFNVDSKILAYSVSVKNGIRWLPNERGQSSPQNIESLSLTGIELSNQTSWNSKNLGISAGVIVSQTLASISEERFENDASVDKQLIYTPEWQYKANLSIRYRDVSTSAFYSYVDERFSTSDHSSPFDPLSAYQSIDWVANFKVDHRLATHVFQLTIRNLIDDEYSIIRDYPLPGRHFKISIKTNF
jgi:iron complex outermembrane receptor protein